MTSTYGGDSHLHKVPHRVATSRCILMTGLSSIHVIFQGEIMFLIILDYNHFAQLL